MRITSREGTSLWKLKLTYHLFALTRTIIEPSVSSRGCMVLPTRTHSTVAVHRASLDEHTGHSCCMTTLLWGSGAFTDGQTMLAPSASKEQERARCVDEYASREMAARCRKGTCTFKQNSGVQICLLWPPHAEACEPSKHRCGQRAATPRLNVPLEQPRGGPLVVASGGVHPWWGVTRCGRI